MASVSATQYVRGVLDRRPRNVVSIGQLVDVIAEAVEVRLRGYFSILDSILQNHTGSVEHRLMSDLTRLEAKLDNQTNLLKKPNDHISPVMKDQFHRLEEKIDNYTFLLAEPLLNQQRKEKEAKRKFMDCSSVARGSRYAMSGVYWINVPGIKERKAFCTIQAGSGWTVIMQRMDGSVNFNRPWIDYKIGFGNVEGEYWIGNEVIHRLTYNRTMALRVVMKSMWILGGEAVSLYHNFRIGNESSGYRLYLSGYDNSSTGGDSMTSTTEYCKDPPNNGSRFSTSDRENNPANCSTELSGGWWFSICGCSNLNGQYFSGGSVISDNKNVGIYWDTVYRNLFGLKNSLRAVRMEIKMVDDGGD